jgi:RNA polymerase sigma-70 factor (ECF subfamily)
MKLLRRKASPAIDPQFESEALVHRDELFATALRLTRNPSDAEDLVQDAYMRALSSWSSYQQGSNCRAWLMRILTNSFINNYRKRRRHLRFAHESGNDAVVALYGSDVDKSQRPYQDIFEGELSDEVKAALAELGEDYRAVVEMADLEGTKYRDIAKKLGVPMGTVMSRLYRARRQLESALQDFAASDYGICRAA